jgi:hypothetical protein
LSTDEPIRAHDELWEAVRLKEETDALLAEINSRGKTRPLMLRARNLRKRVRALDRTLTRSQAYEVGLEIGFRERSGRDPVDGDPILPQDEACAEKFVEALQSKAGTC